MKKQELDEIRVELTKMIDAWQQKCTEDDRSAMERLNIYQSNSLASLMAEAATNVLAAVADSQEYMAQQGYVKD